MLPILETCIWLLMLFTCRLLFKHLWLLLLIMSLFGYISLQILLEKENKNKNNFFQKLKLVMY